MKFGFRVPSLKKRISARISIKRVIRHSLGIKAPRGFGIITNPKRAIYNAVYKRTTFGLGGIKIKSKKRKVSKRIGNEIIESDNLVFQEKVTNSKSSVLDKHFDLSIQIPLLYKQRNEPGMLEKTIEACQQQISISQSAAKDFLKEYPGNLPIHVGYEKLAIIFEKQGKIKEAISLCEKAKGEGWANDWDKRIERYKKY